MNRGSVYFSNTWSIFRMILSAPLPRGRNHGVCSLRFSGEGLYSKSPRRKTKLFKEVSPVQSLTDQCGRTRNRS